MAKYISKVQLPDGSAYEIKDAEARVQLEILFGDELIFDCGSSIELNPNEIIIDCGTSNT